MKLFFEICKEFFDMLYLPNISDIIENEIIREEIKEELDEEKGFIEEKENHDYEYIQNEEQKNDVDIQYYQEKQEDKQDTEHNDDKEFSWCEVFRQTLSIINARIYKFINDNKSE